MDNIIQAKIPEENILKNPSVDRIAEIHNTYTQALVRIGIDPEGMDLLEVIAALAEELAKTKVEFYQFKNEINSKIWNLTWR